MELVVAQSDCIKCNRHVECGCPGIPSRLGDVLGGSSTGPALLVVGEQPGFWETRKGKCFVGKSGEYLTEAYMLPALTQHFSSIYYGNAIRCENRRNIAVTHLVACRPYLMSDIRSILDAHGHLVILALGRYASMCLLNRGVRDAFKVQGHPLPGEFWLNFPRQKKGAPPLNIAQDLLPKGWVYVDAEDCGPEPTQTKAIIPIFSTYHPAALMSGRNPSYRRAVFDHLSLLERSMHKKNGCWEKSTDELPILQDVAWTEPGTTHRLPEPTQ